MTWRKGPKIEVQCETCGKKFLALTNRRKKGWGRFCSTPCANKWRAIKYHSIGRLELGAGNLPYRRTNSRSRFKEAAREAVGHKCQICERFQKLPRLDVHRMTRSVMGGKYQEGQIMVCCRSCHTKIERAK